MRKGGGRDENRIEARLYACKLGIYPVVRRTWRKATTSVIASRSRKPLAAELGTTAVRRLGTQLLFVRSSWLYLETRSERHSEPVLI